MKNKVLPSIITSVVSLLIAAMISLSGCAVSSYDWFVNTVQKNYLYSLDVSLFNEDDLKGNAEKYLDMYSEYYTAEEYQSALKSNAGSKSGLGLSYAFVQDKGVYVSSVIINSPAYMCGLRAGEWLSSGALNGEQTAFESSSDFSSLINRAADGEEITFTSVDGGIYTAAKSEYTASYAYMATNSTAWVFGDKLPSGLAAYERPQEKIPYLPDGAAYIKLSQFYGTAAEEFDVLIGKFNSYKCTSLILDLRTNGGGYVSLMQNMAYSFSGDTKKLAMLSRDKNGVEEKYYCEKVKSSANVLAKGTRVYVLANSGTASASEALIGAMVCYGVLDYKDIFLSQYSDEYTGWLESTGQEVKSSRTYGKGIMQSTFVNRSTGEALKLTTAQIYWPDQKTSIHDRGVTVGDGCTPVYAEWQHTKTDAELQAAVEIIKTR